jgi:hypothetical protein
MCEFKSINLLLHASYPFAKLVDVEKCSYIHQTCLLFLCPLVALRPGKLRDSIILPSFSGIAFTSGPEDVAISSLLLPHSCINLNSSLIAPKKK